ncbi:Thioredoxin-domain-containing protein [Mycena venus]|uniref:Thioredoxin-domain-containing protein n=1 Tax=Mycena venus TaxID=2733690 RepID=A0A8H7DA41_9AGAR|nr:Thioredoxin-domain-containing protein [Mycena venus]
MPTSHHHHDLIPTVVEAVEAALSEEPGLRRISAPKRATFALDLALIALGCRCACLVDVVVVQDPEQSYANLLRTLRQKHAIFDIVQHLFESSSEQSFFVNTEQFQASTSVTDTLFVLLGRDPQLLARPPPDVLAALHALAATTPPTLPRDLTPHTIIPLAGVLLGYPVAYVPGADDGAFLAQVSLDVFACRVRAPTWEHAFLKFSCPATLAAAHPELLSPTRIVESLKTRFEARLKELGLALIVEHSTEIMDRVAL